MYTSKHNSIHISIVVCTFLVNFNTYINMSMSSYVRYIYITYYIYITIYIYYILIIIHIHHTVYTKPG